MTLDRFTDLAAAYGADIARWPEAERTAARALAQSEPRAAAILADAGILDRALHAAVTPPASRALYERVIAEAPALVARGRLARWMTAVGLGAALAMAAASGVAVGAVFAPSAVLQLQSADPLSEANTLLDPSDAGSQTG